MPWYAVEFLNQDLIRSLKLRFETDEIPSLILLDIKSGTVLHKNAISSMMADPEGLNFPWTTKSCEILNDVNVKSIDLSPAFFIFCETNQKALEIQDLISDAIDVWRGKKNIDQDDDDEATSNEDGHLEGSEECLFFVVSEEDKTHCTCGEKLKKLVHLPENACLAAIDVASEYAVSDISSLEGLTSRNV